MSCIGGAACIGLFWFYGIGHLVMHVSLAKLWEPFGLVSILTLLLAPSMYWAKTDSRGNPQRVSVVVGGYLWSTSIIYIAYCTKFGVIAAEDTVPVCIIITIMIVLGCVGGYRASKNLSKESDRDSA